MNETKTISADPRRKTRIAYIIEAGFEYFISLFVTGTFLGYILDTLGFNDAMQGIISTVATFTLGAQLFALFLRGRRAKRIVTIGHLINQLAFMLLYLLPIFDISPALRTALLMVLLFSGHIINNAINPAKITWLMTSVPNDKRGGFTAVKEMISLAGGIVVSLALGAVADIFRDADGLPTRPYYIICCVALLIMTAIHTVTLLVSREEDTVEEKVSIGRTLSDMVHNRDLIKVILVGIIWNIASGFSVSFYTSYLREELAFKFTIISAISMVASICRILVSPLVGRIADKRSFAFSMTLCFAAVGAGFFSMIFVTPETRWLYLVYACLHAFSMAGINSGVINLIYDYVQPRDRAVAMGVKNALGGILGFLATLLSGVVVSSIQAAGGFRILGMTLYAQQVLSVVSFVVTMLLIIYMRVVIKPLKRV